MANQHPDNIVLIGYRGAGKTTVGRALAARLGWPFADTDALIEAEAGRSIADLFAAEGQAGFRRREREAIARVTAAVGQVIAVGGGAVTDPANLERLRSAGTVVWLTARAEVLWRRIRFDANTHRTRPGLTDEGGLQEVRTVLAHREAAYRAVAHLVLDTEERDVSTLATAILAAIDERSTP